MDDMAKEIESRAATPNRPTAAPAAAGDSRREIAISTVEDLRQLLTPREVDVEIMGIKISEEVRRIQATFEAAMKSNAQWFMNYVKTTARPGEPLAYHPNFGVTKEEYDRYLNHMANIQYEPAGSGRLRFTAQPDGTTLMENVSGLDGFHGMVIDTKNARVETPWGTVPLNDPVHSPSGSALGKWDGFGGSMNSGTPQSGSFSMLKFDLGRLADAPLNIMRARVSIVENGVKTKNFESVIRFP
jgi:hypothetical protein